MAESLQKQLQDAVWVGKSLFDRGKTAGSSANMSFLWEGRIYITGTGTCFDPLEKESFSVIDPEGNHLKGIRPSKECPLHTLFYRTHPEVKAVLHIHSFYAVLWSCYCKSRERNVIPGYTPYLQMRLGAEGGMISKFL